MNYIVGEICDLPNIYRIITISMYQSKIYLN